MYQILHHAHSGLRWAVLALIVVTIIQAASKMQGNNTLGQSQKKWSLFTLMATHLQVIIGLVLYFLSPKVQFSGDTMSNSMLRFFTMEHTLMMLIAVVLVTIGNRMAKSGNAKRVFWYYLIALLIILAGIPWPFREELGAGWF